MVAVREKTPYNPSIQALLEQCQDDWGKPEDNRKLLVPYGINYIDQALYGMDIVNGELVLVQGEEKKRKTTMVINVLINYMQGKLPEEKPFTVIDTLESGMRPKRYRDTLIANLATRRLMELGHEPAFCDACGEPQCMQLGISPEFLRYNTRTQEQQKAIDWAIEQMYKWPMHIYGANPDEGDTRNLRRSVQGTYLGNYADHDLNTYQESRWEKLIGVYGAKIFVTDHVQQYAFEDQPTDYEKQIRAIAAVSDVVAKYGIVCLLISQVSLTSVREANNGGKYRAAGGSKAAQEATCIFSVRYESGSGIMEIKLEDSRKASGFSVYQRLEDVSGAFIGSATKTVEGD